MSGKTRTFVPFTFGTYALDSAGESGFLTVLASTSDAMALQGIIAESDLSTGAFGLAHTGTAPTNLPNSGTVNYTAADGVVLGPTVGQCGVNFDCVGDVNIAANFTSGEVVGTFSNFNGGLSNVGFSGTMNSGNTLYSSESLTYAGSATTGTLIGGFYGNAGHDTAGVIDVNVGSTQYLGGYVASSP